MEMNSPEEPLPPEEMLVMFGGPTAFKQQGQNWVRYFKESCDLKPDHHVLDVGCGVGRVAISLAGYLTPGSRYEGLDIVPARINWCKENITPKWPNFQFRLADISNQASNPQGEIRAKDYTLPYGDEEFDFAFLISVFTHMLPEDVEQYLAEIARVLRKGAMCLITYLLLNDESARFAETEGAGQQLRHNLGEYRLANREIPEQLVAYREDFAVALYEKVGLEIRRPIHYGRWAAREAPENQDFMLQDCILARRPPERVQGGLLGANKLGRTRKPSKAKASVRKLASRN
jgi:SAM-dependent methyltransferase